jgi:hypothetical protein
MKRDAAGPSETLLNVCHSAAKHSSKRQLISLVQIFYKLSTYTAFAAQHSVLGESRPAAAHGLQAHHQGYQLKLLLQAPST